MLTCAILIWTAFVCGNAAAVELTYTYYADTGLIQSKLCPGGDEYGNLYYHYVNENFDGRGWGRLLSLITAMPDADNAIGYEFEYYDGTENIMRKRCYSAADYSDLDNPVMTGLEVTYTFYANGLLESKLLETADGGGSIYYHYIDEDYYGSGFGRIDVQVLTSVDDTGSIAYEYEYYAGTDIISKKKCYGSADYSNAQDPACTDLKLTYTFYQSALLESKTSHVVDQYGYLTYWHYLNENFENKGYGRIDVQVYSSEVSGAAYIFAFEYYENSPWMHFKRSYSAIDYSDPSSPLLSGLLCLQEYAENGSELRTTFYYADTGYVSGIRDRSSPMEITYFFNEDWDGSGCGRISREVPREVDMEGADAYEYEYYEDTDTVHFKRCYGRVWNESGYYEYGLLYTYEFDESGDLLSRTINASVVYTYYNSSYMPQSKTFLASDQYGNLYYHFLNESFYTQQYPYSTWGRVDRQVCASADGDGAVAYEYEYYDGSSVFRYKRCYALADYNDPANPIFSDLVCTYEYDADGKMIRKVGNGIIEISDYYDLDAVSGKTWVNTSTLQGAALEYYDDIENNLASSSSTDGTKVMYEYYEGTSQVHYEATIDHAAKTWTRREFDIDGNEIIENLESISVVRIDERNENGKVTKKTRYDGVVITISYNADTGKIETRIATYPNGRTVTRSYDADGRLTGYCRSWDDLTMTYSGHDALGRYTRIDRSDGTYHIVTWQGESKRLRDEVCVYSSSTGELIATRAFDSSNRIARIDLPSGQYEERTYFGISAKISTRTVYKINGAVIVTKYNADGRLVRENENTGAFSVFTDFDHLNRVMCIDRFNSAGTFIGRTTFEYNEDGSYVKDIYYASGFIKYRISYLVGGVETVKTKYWNAPSMAMHYQWLADTPASNEIVFKEYDEQGLLVIYIYDNGTEVTATTQITDNDVKDFWPDISDSQIVWLSEDINDINHMYLYDGSSVISIPLTSNFNTIPLISDGYVTWRSMEAGDDTIYLFNGVESIPIGTGNIILGPNISGDNVVWNALVGSYTQVFYYDGSTTMQFTTDDTNNIGPEIDGNQIAWLKNVGGHNHVFFYDGSAITQLTSGSYDAGNISIDGGKIAWTQYDGATNQIYYYDGNTIIKLTEDANNKFDTMVSNGQVVWREYDGANNHIFLYDGTTTIQLSGSCDYNIQPCIDDGKVVWTGQVGDRLQIFYYDGERVYQITNDDRDNLQPKIDNGDIVWTKFYGEMFTEGEIFSWSLPETVVYKSAVFQGNLELADKIAIESQKSEEAIAGDGFVFVPGMASMPESMLVK